MTDQPTMVDGWPSDGTITLKIRGRQHAAAQLAGEDPEIIRWVNDEPSTPESVRSHIEAGIIAWQVGGPVFSFGIFDAQTDELIGNLEINLLDPHLEPGEANVSYNVFPNRRREGIATRAVLLARALAEKPVLQIDPLNRASIQVATKAGFVEVGTVKDSPNLRFEVPDT